MIEVDDQYHPTLIVVDNFYKDPHQVRELALSQKLEPHPLFHKGKRTEASFANEAVRQRFEAILGKKIVNWNNPTNGVFQVCVSTDPIVYHTDLQQLAGVIFLTPDAPLQSGTKILRSIHTKQMKVSDDAHTVFQNGFYDSTQFEVVDQIGNVFNRLVLWDARCLHAASTYFGTNDANGRLFQVFFFDIDNSGI